MKETAFNLHCIMQVFKKPTLSCNMHQCDMHTWKC